MKPYEINIHHNGHIHKRAQCNKTEGMLNQLMVHQNEMEESSKFIEALREQFIILEQGFNSLSNEKKMKEFELNSTITYLNNTIHHLQLENEQLLIKYNSSKQKIKSMQTTNRAENDTFFKEKLKLQKENEDLADHIKDLIQENQRLITQVNFYYNKEKSKDNEIPTYDSNNKDNDRDNDNDNGNDNCNDNNNDNNNDKDKIMTTYNINNPHNETDSPKSKTFKNELSKTNDSISKLSLIIKDLEAKNEALIKEVIDQHNYLTSMGSYKEVIVGLKHAIAEKEKTIKNLYNKYDKLNIKFEEETIKNDSLISQIQTIKSQMQTTTGMNNYNSHSSSISNPFFINHY